MMAPIARDRDNWALADLVQVRTEKPFGSGLLVAQGLVLTALHCVADPDKSWTLYQTIAVNLWRDLFGLDGAPPNDQSYRATVIWRPKLRPGYAPPDIALLRLRKKRGKPIPCPKRVGQLKYADLGMDDADVVAIGFPALLEGAPLLGGRGDSAFSGKANFFKRSPPTISFTSRLIAAQSGWEQWSGLSGGPLFRGDALVGIMRGGQTNFSTDRNLEAEPLGPLMRDTDCEKLAQWLDALDEAAGPISPRELIKLKRLITQEGVEPDAVRDAYLVSYVSAMAPITDGPALSSGLIDDVAAHGVSAMWKFLTRLVVDNSGIRKDIEEWMSQQPAMAGLQVAESPQAPLKDIPVVLIKVTSTAETVKALSSRDRTYLVEAWVFDGIREARPVDPGDEIREVKHGFAKLPNLIQTFVTRSLRYLPTSPSPRVELALPFDLLADGVERWLVKAGRLVQRPLGTKFPLALRSYERLYDRDLENSWYDWRQSWNGLPPRIGERELHWIASQEAWGEQLYDAINGQSLVCVALACGGPDGIGMLVEAGAPVAIWLKEPPLDLAAARAEIEQLVCGFGIHDLPARIQNQRKLAAGAVAWDGMALLFDDPNRLPPDAHARLQSV